MDVQHFRMSLLRFCPTEGCRAEIEVAHRVALIKGEWSVSSEVWNVGHIFTE